MKKSYIIPSIVVMRTETIGHVLVGSLPQGETTVTGDRGGWTKENTRQDYNVWNDDWQNQ